MNNQNSVEDKIQALQMKYLASLPQKLAVIQQHWQAVLHNNTFKDKELESTLHKLAGSAGMYQLDKLGQIAREVELIVAASDNPPDTETVNQIVSGLSRLEQTINELTEAVS